MMPMISELMSSPGIISSTGEVSSGPADLWIAKLRLQSHFPVAGKFLTEVCDLPTGILSAGMYCSSTVVKLMGRVTPLVLHRERITSMNWEDGRRKNSGTHHTPNNYALALVKASHRSSCSRCVLDHHTEVSRDQSPDRCATSSTDRKPLRWL